MLTRRELLGVEFYAFCQVQYDNARRFLKTCGPPSDEISKFLISNYKEDEKIFHRFLTGKGK